MPTVSLTPPPHRSASGWQSFLLPSATDLVFLGLLFSLSCGVIAPRLLSDAGIGWHIRNGQLMLQAHAITRTDPFSSTMSGQVWYAWEWLYDLVIAVIYQAMGLNGVVFVTALAIAATFALTLRFAVARGGNLPVTVFLLALAIAASAIHLFARPHIFSWLFVVIWFHLLDSWETDEVARNSRLLWLPALMLVWVNLHGGFITGFILLGIYMVSESVRYATGREPNRLRRLKSLVGITVTGVAATFVNPYGYSLHIHIYQYLTNQFLMNHIQEFRSPDFHGAAQQCFLALLFIAFLTLATRRGRLRTSQLLLIIFAAASGLYSARSLPISSILLVLTVAPVLSQTLAALNANRQLARWLAAFLAQCNSFAARMAGMESSMRGHVWPAIGIALGLWICLHNGNLAGRQVMNVHFPEKRFPVQAVDFLIHSDTRQPVFCPDYWGGYLIFRLYPQTKVVVDDRHDLYGEQFFRQYLKTVQAEPEWEELLDQKHVTVVLAPDGSALANVLRESSNWTVLFRGPRGIIFRRPGD